MICEIIVPKTVYGILFFCQSSFINNFMEKNNFTEPQNYQKLNISRPIYFKKNSAHRFEDRICTNMLEGFLFFQKTFFSRGWSFFHDYKTTSLGVIFFHKKLILYFFSPVDTQRRFNVDTTPYDVVQRCIDVETTSCVYWKGDYLILI